METAENPKSVFGSEEKTAHMGSQKISVSDHVDGSQCAGDKSDSLVIDMDSLTGKVVPANPRTSRNLSRKWPYRGGEEKVIPSTSSRFSEKNQKDSSPPSPSPRAARGPERPTSGLTEHTKNLQIQHQITITATNFGTSGESRCARKNSFRRTSMSPPWVLNPKRILFIFATLSSIGTMMLIYFTLLIGKLNGADRTSLDLQQ